MQLVVAEFLLSFPFLHVTLDNPEALRLFQVDAYGDFLASDIEFG